MQEYVEAATFAHYCRYGEVASLDVLNQQHGEGLQNLRVLEADYVLGVGGGSGDWQIQWRVGVLPIWRLAEMDSIRSFALVGKNTAKIRQKHGKNTAKTRQKHGRNMAETRQKHSRAIWCERLLRCMLIEMVRHKADKISESCERQT